MAFDGIVVAGIVKELRDTCMNAHISKIAQPESDALLLTLKGSFGQRRLFLSANASLPFACFTAKNKQFKIKTYSISGVLERSAYFLKTH